MLIKDKDKWRECIDANEDGRVDTYGGSVIFFAQHWANLMEIELAHGKKLEEIAQACASRADEDMGRFGMTGFQYGAAVSILSACWMHGEELRLWHNIDTQIGDEGERANERGGVLNPALLTIGKNIENN